MTKTITLPHAVAMTLGLAAVGYQTAVVWEALEGVTLITKLGVPLATISAALLPIVAEAAWHQRERVKCLLLALPVVALILFVLPSGISRLGEAQQARRDTAITSKGDLVRATKLVEQSTEWVAAECKSGHGPKCKGQMYTLEQRQAHLEKLMKAGQPVEPWLPAWHAATLPIGLELAIWACFFYGFGPLARRTASAVKAHTFEIPRDEKELEEAKQFFLKPEAVKALKTRGMKHDEIAALFGVNQGRISELYTGKRASLELRTLN